MLVRAGDVGSEYLLFACFLMTGSCSVAQVDTVTKSRLNLNS